ncbi:hypothetical protein DL98DRAFT_652299 [Cadophora sp. DSE1049]|nr:hypothetical protein DL98DRAFT_652299 [Cadophora sp. DSE1049]
MAPPGSKKRQKVASRLIAPCTCHPLNEADWPLKSATIQVAWCMERCPYCGQKFPSCFDLQDHLEGKNYQDRKLKLLPQLKTLALAPTNLPQLRFTESKSRDASIISSRTPTRINSRQSTSSRTVPAPKPSQKSALKDFVETSNSPPKEHLKSLSIESSISTSDQKANETPRISSDSELQRFLQRLEEFGTAIKNIIEDVTLTTLMTMNKSQMDLWNGSTTTWPQIFRAEECWKKKSPSSEELILETLDLIAARKAAEKRNKVDDYKVYIVPYSQGLVDSDMDPRKAIAQLHEPDKSNPVGLIGYRLPKFMPDVNPGFVTPAALTKFVEPFNEENRQVLLTPKFWATDLHIGIQLRRVIHSHRNMREALAYVSSYAKESQAHESADGQRSKLERIGKDLEGGLMIHADSTQALYIPAGCIHAVYTLHGGFLVTLEFTTPRSVKVLSALLNAQFDRFKDQWLQSELPGQFIDSVGLALTQNQTQVGIDAWITTQDRLRLWVDKEQDSHEATRNQYWVDRRPGWEEKLRNVWKTFFGSAHSGLVLSCPCQGMRRGQTFKDHLYSEHFVVDRIEESSRNGAGDIGSRKKKRRKVM